MAVSVVLVTILASAVLALGYLTLRDMYAQSSPTVFAVEPGTYNLTASDLETTAEEIGQYVFYTNYQQIKAEVRGDGTLQGRIMLWNTADSSDFIQVHDVSRGDRCCTFTGLSSANRYRITCDDLDGAEITVSEGRTVSFWRSLKAVLGLV